MKRIIITFCFSVLLLAGCTEKADKAEKQIEEIEVNNSSIEEIEEIEEDIVKTLSMDSAKFHFVVDWLTDSKIVFVEKDQNVYYLKSFNITTGTIETLYKEANIIVDVLIHPSKSLFLLHTTDNSTSTTIKTVSFEGVIQDEVSIASSELAIEWNDLDPSLILLTAFYQDWTYDVFLYNGKEQEVNLLSLDDPFPKWLGERQVVTVQVPDHPLNGGEIFFYNYVTETREQPNMTDVIHFDTYKDSLLIVQLKDNNAEFKIVDDAKTVLSKWEMPAVSNYSEWVFPEVSWIDNTTVITSSSSKGGQLDDLEEPFKLVQVVDGQQDVIIENTPPGTLRCSSTGEKCLAGYAAEKIINTNAKEIDTWLLLSE